MIPYIEMLTSTNPQNVTKNVPNSISKQVNKILPNEHVSNSTKSSYNNALKNGGFKEKY